MPLLTKLLLHRPCPECGAWGASTPCIQCLAPELHSVEGERPCIRQLLSAYRYHSAAGDIIRVSKARRERAPFVVMSRLVANDVRTRTALDIDIITPVPSHWQRQVSRGFNAPDVFANALSQCLHKPVRQLLVNGSSSAQKSRNRRERLVHAKARFRADKHIENHHVLLVDDVTTTGATLACVAAELLGAGARAVTAITLCAVQ